MTDHTPLPVAGYTAQSQSNVELANEGKELEERYLRWLDKLQALNGWVASVDGRAVATAQGDMRIDPRCVAEARTCIQTGAMWAVRAIFKPQRIKLPDDAP